MQDMHWLKQCAILHSKQLCHLHSGKNFKVNQRNGACYFDRQNFEFSALCSVHFNPDCFSFRQRFKIEQMGRKPKKVVLKNENAVPAIYSINAEPESSANTSQKRSGPQMLSSAEKPMTQSSPPKKYNGGINIWKQFCKVRILKLYFHYYFSVLVLQS